MNALLAGRLVIAGVGILVWAYGARENLQMARLIGIGMLAIALLVRFAAARPTRSGTDDED